MTRENIAILLTPAGAAAIAVIRLCGPGVARFLASHFSCEAPAGRCVHGTLHDASRRPVDDPLVVRWSGGEGDIADFNVHGGPWVVRCVLDLATKAGFELRDAGRAPAVAFPADSIIEREMLEALPLARTELALRTLLAQPPAWSAFDSARPPAADRIDAMLADRALEHLLNPPRVAIVGAPNVGKSTLANCLFAQERSITADLPGTTRDWVGEVANIDGLPVVLVDTPGVRDTTDPIEREAIARGGAEVAKADLVLLVQDAGEPANEDQFVRMMYGSPVLKVMNKLDRFGGALTEGIGTIATTGAGIPALRRAILRHFGCEELEPARPRAWTERQRRILRAAREAEGGGGRRQG